MSLQSRLAALTSAVGADVKALYGRSVPAGGTSGQVLTKSSAADYATSWASPSGRTSGVYTPRSGAWTLGDYTAQGAATLNSGTQYMRAMDLYQPVTVQSIGVHCSGAQTGGSIQVILGVYADDGTGGAPDLTKLLVSSSVVASGTTALTTGRQVGAVSATITAPRVWTAFLYIAATTPSTAPTFIADSAGRSMWILDATSWGNGVQRSLVLTGQSALATTNATSPAPNTAGPPLVGLRLA